MTEFSHYGMPGLPPWLDRPLINRIHARTQWDWNTIISKLRTLSMAQVEEQIVLKENDIDDTAPADNRTGYQKFLDNRQLAKESTTLQKTCDHIKMITHEREDLATDTTTEDRVLTHRDTLSAEPVEVGEQSEEEYW